eukprot:6482185-Amphidinium_carterae.6
MHCDGIRLEQNLSEGLRIPRVSCCSARLDQTGPERMKALIATAKALGQACHQTVDRHGAGQTEIVPLN